MRAGRKERLAGLAQTGYCAALKRWFHGVREHLLFTPQGRLARIVLVAGNRHDVQGLYALLQTSFTGHLLGDNAYWPRAERRAQLAEQEITVQAASRSNWRFQYPPAEQAWLKRTRGGVERRIGLFDQQFDAGRTRCRSVKHLWARRWTKALAHNASRQINAALRRPLESVQHLHLAA